MTWNALIDRYDNKRMQINEQLKVLFNLSLVSTDSNSSLKSLQRSVNSSLEPLKALNVDTRNWDSILIYLCSTKLPTSYLEDFAKTLEDSSKLPSWRDFEKFLTQKFKILESVSNNKKSTSQPNDLYGNYSKSNIKAKNVSTFQTNTNSYTTTGHISQAYTNNTKNKSTNVICQLCKKNHFLRNCPKFLEKNINDRNHVVKITRTCYNCLSLEHSVKGCRSKFSCRNCNQRYHTLLHKGNEA